MTGLAAVLVGTSHYPQWNDKLPQVRHAVLALREVLARPETTLLGGPAAHLVDGDRDAVTRLLLDAAAEPTGTLLLYVAGHAVVARGELYFVLPDTDPDRVELTGLPAGALVRAAHTADTSVGALVVLDCCFSGEALGEGWARPLAERSIVVLTGGQARDALPSGDEHGCTPFTADLVDVLRAGLPDAGEWLDAQAVHEELARRADLAGRPVPQLAFRGPAPHLRLTRNAAHDSVLTGATNAVTGTPNAMTGTLSPAAGGPAATPDRRVVLEHRYLSNLRTRGAGAPETLAALRELAFWTAEGGAGVRALALYRTLLAADSNGDRLTTLVTRYRHAALAVELGVPAGDRPAGDELREVAAALRAEFPGHPEAGFAAADAAANP